MTTYLLVETVKAFMEQNGYKGLEPQGAERGDCLVWTWIRSAGKIHSYVEVALGNLEEPDAHIEIWAGADDGAHAGRLLIKEIDAPIHLEKTDSTVLDMVAAAVKMANDFPSGEMRMELLEKRA